jgi:threonine aldolase
MRFQSVQLIAYLTDDTWLTLAAGANRQMARLAAGLTECGVEFVNRPDVNMVFARIDEATADRLEAAGLLFYRIGHVAGQDSARVVVRFVTSWQTTDADVEHAVAAFRTT